MAAALIDRIEQSQLAVIRTGLIQTHGAALSCANLSDSDSGRLLELLIKELIVSPGDSSLSSSLSPTLSPFPSPSLFPSRGRESADYVSLSRSLALSLARPLRLSHSLSFSDFCLRSASCRLVSSRLQICAAAQDFDLPTILRHFEGT
jgi:hypothetical protein